MNENKRHKLFAILAICVLCPVAVSGAPQRATASGKVLDSDGKPVEHAMVLVYEGRPRHGYSVYCPTCWVDCGRRGVTDAAGKYSISGLNSDLVFKLLIVGNGFKATFVGQVDPSNGPAADAILKQKAGAVDPSHMVKGKVVDEQGSPVRDAVVEQQGVAFNGPRGLSRSFGSDESPDWIQPLAATDEKGEFEIAYAKPATEITLNVSPRAMAGKLVTLPTGPEKKTIQVTRGATIRGRLLQPDGAPVANAEVGVIVHNRVAGMMFPEISIGTQDDGTFTITNVPAGRIWYVYPKMASLASRKLAGDAIPIETKDDGEEVDVGTIQLRPAYTLRGKVVLSDGKPMLPDMHVTANSDTGFDQQIVSIAEDGSFEIGGLSKGVYSIDAAVRGYKTADRFSGEVLVDRDGKNVVIPMNPGASR